MQKQPNKGPRRRHVPTGTTGIYWSGWPNDKVWECRYTNSSGKRVMETVGRREEALARLAEVTGSKAKGAAIVNVTATVGDLIARRRESRTVKRSSARIEDRNIRLYIAPRWGRVRARDVRRHDLVVWYNGLQKQDGTGPLGGGTKRLVLSHLTAILQCGVEDVIAVNPAKLIDSKDKPKSEEKLARILGPGELDALLAGCGSKDWLRDIIVVTLHQALRLGEAVGLRWPDVDFEGGKLTVRDQDYRDGSRDTPKGNKAATIDLMPAARAVLLRLWMAQGRPSVGPVFRNSYGGVRRYGDVDRAFRVARAELPTEPRAFTFYDLRHTSISRLANAPGAIYPQVQAFARHSKLTTTLGYIHSIDNAEWTEPGRRT